MKIRRAFGGNALTALFDKEKKALVVATALPVIYQRDRHIVDRFRHIDICESRLIGGSILNLRYVPTPGWWGEITTGIEKERVKSCGTTTFKDSRTGFDDIVLAGGHNIFFNKDTQLVLYGLTGFPTKRNVTLREAQDTLVGTRFFSLGVGWEFSYSFINTLARALTFVVQNRFLHFFARTWYPILPCDAKIQPGNATDILCALQFREQRDIFEVGYNPTFFTNQAVRAPAVITKADTYIRQSGYVNYSHVCKRVSFFGAPFIVGAGFNISRTNLFDTKAVTAWLNFTALF